jgi:hypothetical protein
MSAHSFAYLKDYSLDGSKTIDFPLPIRGNPVLKLRPAVADNRKYRDEMLRAARERIAVANEDDSKKTPAQREADDRAGWVEQAGIYARSIVETWDPCPIDDAGERVPFSVEECTKLLEGLANDATWLLRRLVAAAGRSESFLRVTNEEAAGVAKNS